MTEAGKKRLIEKSGYYLMPYDPKSRSGKGFENRANVADQYNKEYWKKVEEYGSNEDLRLLDVWRKYLSPYASATLKDLNIEDTLLARTFIEDHFYKNDDELNGKWLQKQNDDIWEQMKRDRGYSESVEKSKEQKIKKDQEAYDKQYPNQNYSISSIQKSKKFKEYCKQYGVENYDPDKDDDDELNFIGSYLDHLYDSGDIDELKSIHSKK